ncbi:histidinol-phosphatase HisJ family protein [Anaeromicropila populeti]|uniref:Histidinol-phosphatase n=1 Tax=Anaeromicropila populeti TaxID=37658 RepID=A0A1I6KW83_9FIRM|nr:histidinol-phosphatase HisJ family protein [Anaeromicropila populeti]SFR95485.1 histidinol-phosphatase (PHP family) [Anaeromicropila populeti]
MMLADYHVHSDFSSDSRTPMHNMIEKAISMGLERICFTDHMDYDFPIQYKMLFEFDPEEYFRKITELSALYPQINILKGIEIGMRPYLAKRFEELISTYSFDFVICSTHLVGDRDPYYKDFWENKTLHSGMKEYFQSILANIEVYHDFDVYGHLDYMIRYAPVKNKSIVYSEYQDLLDEILKKLLSLGKGIEVNTSGFKYGLGHPNPHEEILTRYLELGGEILTIGSDGHCPEHLGYDFDKIVPLLKSLGFRYYTIFENRKPQMLPL